MNEHMANLASRLEILHKILHNTHDVIWAMNIEGRFIYVSPSVVAQRGYTPDEVMAEPAIYSICKEDRQKVLDTYSMGLEFIRGGITRIPAGKVRLRQRCKDGSLLWTEVVSDYIFNEEREFLYVLGLTRDISSLVEAEQRLAQG